MGAARVTSCAINGDSDVNGADSNPFVGPRPGG